MRVKIPIVKEHGSWVVFIISCIAGIIASLTDHSLHVERGLFNEVLITVVGLALLVNSKRPLTALFRRYDREKEDLIWFLLFSLSGLALLVPFLLDGFKTFVIFSPLLIIYFIFLCFRREHDLAAEFLGFAILTLSAPVIYFVLTGRLSFRLYLAVFIFFAASVLKVRTSMKKLPLYRLSMIFYCAVSPAFFIMLGVSPYLLLPLSENVVSSVRNREERLRTLGNIELVKGVIFVLLLLIYWR
jgi:hypothetical protein